MNDREAQFNLAFAQELRAYRKRAGRTLEQMYQALGWTRGTYDRTEDGVRTLAIADIFEAAAAMGRSPSELFETLCERVESEGGRTSPSSERK